MNEYNDAIQRLEIQERVPSLGLPKLHFPIPRKDTPRNYNYIFNTTGNGNIPKYTFPQNLIITEKFEGAGAINYDLDKQFINTPGYRKSIAVRAINITIDSSQSIDPNNLLVCSTINPYSAQNILGRLTETFHNIPRVFPWDGNYQVKVWFNGINGDAQPVPKCTGVIELELIIDNENTYAFDD